jgi:hypothetical protein
MSPFCVLKYSSTLFDLQALLGTFLSATVFSSRGTGMKKTERQAFRISEEDKIALREIADRQQIPSGTIVSALVAQYVQAVKNHGNRLVWPPEFDYYPADTKTSQEESQK